MKMEGKLDTEKERDREELEGMSMEFLLGIFLSFVELQENCNFGILGTQLEATEWGNGGFLGMMLGRLGSGQGQHTSLQIFDLKYTIKYIKKAPNKHTSLTRSKQKVDGKISYTEFLN
jgi:hypothetical protein